MVLKSFQFTCTFPWFQPRLSFFELDVDFVVGVGLDDVDLKQKKSFCKKSFHLYKKQKQAWTFHSEFASIADLWSRKRWLRKTMQVTFTFRVKSFSSSVKIDSGRTCIWIGLVERSASKMRRRRYHVASLVQTCRTRRRLKGMKFLLLGFKIISFIVKKGKSLKKMFLGNYSTKFNSIVLNNSSSSSSSYYVDSWFFKKTTFLT